MICLTWWQEQPSSPRLICEVVTIRFALERVRWVEDSVQGWRWPLWMVGHAIRVNKCSQYLHAGYDPFAAALYQEIRRCLFWRHPYLQQNQGGTSHAYANYLSSPSPRKLLHQSKKVHLHKQFNCILGIHHIDGMHQNGSRESQGNFGLATPHHSNRSEEFSWICCLL